MHDRLNLMKRGLSHLCCSILLSLPLLAHSNDYTVNRVVLYGEIETIDTAYDTQAIGLALVFSEDIFFATLEHAQEQFAADHIAVDAASDWSPHDVGIIKIDNGQISFRTLKTNSLLIEYDDDTKAVGYGYLSAIDHISEKAWIISESTELTDMLGLDGLNSSDVVKFSPMLIEKAEQLSTLSGSAILFGSGCGAGTRACDGADGAP